ncbi:MAG: phosphoribosylformylglycinamidine synthase subunit PurS [Nitrospinae bacterium]|nr:phosphoribosylformylglycinamidine synthase subunit PurS [Nitrospinota bacterium]
MARAKVYVTLKAGILDPQGKAVKGGLEALGFSEVEDVRVGKYIELRVADGSEENLKARIDEMCQRLLANPVIEDFLSEIVQEASSEEDSDPSKFRRKLDLDHKINRK